MGRRASAAPRRPLFAQRAPVRFVLFAGARTAELVQRAIPFAEIALPHAGLSLADRIHWYDERLPRAEWTDSRVLAAVAVKREPG